MRAPAVNGELLQRHRAELHGAYLRGTRRLSWSALRLAAERERRLRELLSWAAERSPFWRSRLAGHDLSTFTEAELSSLPILGRDEMMANFDDLVTVPGLTRDRVAAYLEDLRADDQYLDGEYRAIKTSGANGAEAFHVYGWDAFVTFVMQGSRWTGRRGEPRSAVFAEIFSSSLEHESGVFEAFTAFDSGAPPTLCLSGGMPLPELVAVLNTAEPKVEVLQGWPSTIRLLAGEALAGRLTVAPTWVSVAGEVCNPLVRDAVRAAWGLELSEFWGCSEGTYAFPCATGEGMHISDDLIVLESVDPQGDPVPFGQPGARALLTNLYNLDQPLIRYDIADALTLTDAPCACGCAHRRILDVGARAGGDFEYAGGAVVPRRQLEECLLRWPGVADFLVRQSTRGAEVSVVTDGSCDSVQLGVRLTTALARHGVIDPQVQVRAVETPERLWSGKVRQFAPLG